MPLVDRKSAESQFSPEGLARRFGAQSSWTVDAVQILCQSIPTINPESLDSWQRLLDRWAGRGIGQLRLHLSKLAGRYGVSVSDKPETILLALQTYYALLVGLIADRKLKPQVWDCNALLPDNPFAWHQTVGSNAVDRLIGRLKDLLASTADDAADDWPGDWFKPLYQNLFPRVLRHRLGEYYTPDWLAEHVLDQVGYEGEPGARLLDPACGSGVFLLAAIRRMREKLADKAVLQNVSFPPPIVGLDVNPLAVLTARANYLIALADFLPKGEPVDIPIYLCDSIQSSPDATVVDPQFDFVVGNPPWIAWDNLSEADRTATKPLWERYGLFSLSGNEARHGGGKKDLSMLMLYVAADRYLKPRGRLGMVITQTLFQTKGAGDGFRRFRLGADGPPLGVLRVDDMTAIRPFDDAANWTSTIAIEKGRETAYPVPYVRWQKSEGSGNSFHTDICFARPIDSAKPNSPWLVMPSKGCDDPTTNSNAKAEYTAHLGANTGGANGVYWVEILGTNDEGVLIRNIVARGKSRIETVESRIEPDLLYPLLRWSDVRRWSAVPQGHILLTQEPDLRTGIAESAMRERYPLTLAYVERFRELLSSRAAYRRYQQRGPFYSMYNVGPYTVAPVKVVWRRMDRRINAAVVETVDDSLLGRRPVVPQETCVLVACDSADEAHYLCALLNSAIVNRRISASSVRGGKSFGTPGMLDYLPLRRFQNDDPRHVELASLSREAHAGASESIQRWIDRLANQILEG